MRAEISCKNPAGETEVIPSKSMAHRMLICAALSDATTEIICPASSLDIAATVRCLRELGADISKKDGTYFVTPIKKREESLLSCGESGSTLRFLIPVAASLGGNVTFCGEGRLPERTCEPLVKALKTRGAEIEYNGTLPLITSGGLTSGRFELPGNVSSQFVSGLIFALPLLSGDSSVEITGKIESLPYIEMTLSAVRSFGIEARMNGNKISIPGGQTYRSPGKVKIEGDWSNAAFWAVLGAFSEEGVTVNGVLKNSVQGDRAIVDILRRFGAEVTQGDEFIMVKKKVFTGIKFDASENPDLVPIVAIAAAVANGETQIVNAARLRLKESDRIESTVKMLKDLGADVEEINNGIRIFGKKKLLGGKVDSFNDHRIVMSASVAAAVSENSVVIKGAEAVKKSYGDFFERYTALGAEVIEGEEKWHRK